MYEGVLNVYKERGFTSHDVVAKLRGILKMKKIGHTGTLDPDAEGVLPVCLGQATRLCDMLADETKVYRAVLLLGVETDTQDIGGRVLHRQPVAESEEQVLEAVRSFVGSYDQIPPMYSAVKINGKKLYELARQGKTVERQARRVTIRQIRVEDMSLPRVTMTVHCSKGTYIRTLCHDIGRKLGCGGCMESLLRVSVGRFEVEDSLRLTEIERLRDEGRLASYIVPVEEMFSGYQKVSVLPEADRLARNGNPIDADDVRLGEETAADRLARSGKPVDLDRVRPGEEAEAGSPGSPADGPGWREVTAEETPGSPGSPADGPGWREVTAEETPGSPGSPADGPGWREVTAETGIRQSGMRECRLYDSGGTFLGIYQYEEEKHRLKPRKMFLSRET